MYKRDINTINHFIDFLNLRIPHNNWFIIKELIHNGPYCEIPIYFHSKTDYEASIETFKDIYPSRVFIQYEDDPIKVSLTTDLEDKALLNCLLATNEYNLTLSLIDTLIGSPEEVISKFDLNKLQIAITPDKKVIKSDLYDAPLHMIYENTTSNTSHKLRTYTKDGGYQADYEKELCGYADYVVKNADKPVVCMNKNDLAITHKENLAIILEDLKVLLDYAELTNKYHNQRVLSVGDDESADICKDKESIIALLKALESDITPTQDSVLITATRTIYYRTYQYIESIIQKHFPELLL